MAEKDERRIPADETRYVVRRYGSGGMTPALNAALNHSMRSTVIGSIHSMVPDDEQMVQIGEFMIGKMSDGTLWLQRIDAEGMQVMAAGEEELSALLLEFFRENF